MSDSISVGGYGFHPIETTRSTSDRASDDSKREASKDPSEERGEPATKKELEQKRSPQKGVGDNVDLEA